MQIFMLDYDTEACAQAYMDVHVNKMAVEAAQMLCTAINNYHRGKGPLTPYLSTHRHTRLVKWVGESINNFLWLADLALRLCDEWEYRGKPPLKAKTKQAKAVIRGWRDEEHPVYLHEVIAWCLHHCPRFEHIPMTELPLTNKIEDLGDVIESHRAYYRHKRLTFNVKTCYTNREVPEWIY